MTATILIVDDLESNLKILEAKILAEYYTPLRAKSGREALEMLKNHKIDIVLMDVMMPGLDGFDTCKIIKSNPDTTHIPVVMVTALTDLENRIKGLEAGADEFLTKPVEDIALFARIKSLMRMKIVIDELKLRNKINAELGAKAIELTDNFQGSKLLILDDDIIQAKNLKEAIRPIIKNIDLVKNYEQIDKREGSVPDLVIISCQLDEEDPLRIGVMLRSNPLFSNTVIMFLTDENNIPMVLKGMEHGINDYFLYPVDNSELQARIKTQLRRKQYQDNLRNELDENCDLSKKDALTNVFNRRYFDIHLKQMFDKFTKNNNHFSMIMLDIDDFKLVNDTYGHVAGDEVLKRFAEILKSSIRVTDLIARYGGEEFVILLNNVDLENAIKIAEKIRNTIESTKFIIDDKRQLTQTASIGVAELRPNESIKDFIEKTDKAMYQAKNAGKNKAIASHESPIKTVI